MSTGRHKTFISEFYLARHHAGCVLPPHVVEALMSVTCVSILLDEDGNQVDYEKWHALRAKVVGASEAGALVGEHEYLTYWGLWARKSGKLPAIDDNEAMQRGRYLEPVAAQWIRDRNPTWDVVAPRAHWADHEFGIGCTPDLLVDDPERGAGVIQIKSVAPSVFRTSWRGESDVIRPPLWIAIQALVEAYLTGAKWAAVAPLVVDFGIECPVIDIPLHPGIVEHLKTEALGFWQKVLSGEEPSPDYRRDHELIRAALRKEDGSEIDLSQDNELPQLLDDREAAKRIIKDTTTHLDEIDGRLLHKLGAAAIGRFKGGYISAKTINKAAYAVKATSYRQLRVVRDKGQ
jgi:hypothetical protein